jgi:hypothetical protein
MSWSNRDTTSEFALRNYRKPRETSVILSITRFEVLLLAKPILWLLDQRIWKMLLTYPTRDLPWGNSRKPLTSRTSVEPRIHSSNTALLLITVWLAFPVSPLHLLTHQHPFISDLQYQACTLNVLVSEILHLRTQLSLYEEWSCPLSINKNC